MNAGRGKIRVPSAARWVHRTAIQALAKVAPSHFAARIERPVFLVGCPRSGTSFFDQVFATHPSVVSYPSEALDLWHPQTYPWRAAAVGRDFTPIWGDAEAFTAYSLAQRSETDNRNIRAAFGAVSSLARGSQFVNKCTMIGLMLPKALEIFPDARFVHIVRDGRASALSWAKRQRAEIDQYPAVFDQRGWNRSPCELVRLCGASWKTIVNGIEQTASDCQFSDDRFMRIRYEDFCTDAASVLSSVAEFMNLPPEGFDAEKIASIKSQNYKFQNELSSEHLAYLAEIQGETLAKLGYS